MLFKVGNNIIKGGGNILNITNDLTLKFEVQGTCFPAKVTQGNTNPANFNFISLNNLANKIYIDYADGTGEHEYDFKASGANRQIGFRNLAGATTPETIQGSAWYDATVHFYQDLPEGVKNTVQETYPQKRIITIRFENPQNIREIAILDLLLFGVFPSNLSKYNGLLNLNVRRVYNLETFQQDFYNSAIRNLTFLNIGQVMNNGIPNWIVNSNFLEVLNLAQSVNLSSNLATNNLLNIDNLKETLITLNLDQTGMNYQMPNSVGNLYKLKTLVVSRNNNTGFNLPVNLYDMEDLEVLTASNNNLSFSEIERIIDEVPNLKELNIQAGIQTSNQNITNDNFSLENIYIGLQSWGGSVPNFINKLKALKTLNIQHSSSVLYNGITSWGDYSECTTLTNINIGRLPNFTTTIPSWFNLLVNLKQLNAQASFQNTGGINSFVDNFYTFITSNASMSTGNTAFRVMNINIYGSNNFDNNNSTRPSGTYQQPAGYVQGSNNGTPASQMEKIWVLTNQYAHTWIVKP